MEEVKKLATEVKKNGFTYTLVQRNERAAMYETSISDGTNPYYEVFQIKTAPGGESTISGKLITFSPHERFPSNEDFGKSAWCYRYKDKAEAKYAEISEQGPTEN